MKYTAGQAARATGVATATITRALKSGKISGHKDQNGSWMIDPAELHRVFPPLHPLQESKTERPFMKDTETPERPSEIPALERELETLRDALADARIDRDKWRDMAERLSLAPPSSNVLTSEKSGFWKRLLGRAKR